MEGNLPPMRVPVTVGAYLSPTELQHSGAWASAVIEGATASHTQQ